MLVHEPRVTDLGELEAVLVESFETVRAALARNETVVIVVDDRYLQGNGTPAQAALASGLLGLARALATEGRKDGWRIAVLATTPAVSAAERGRAVAMLGQSEAASGSIVRLGGHGLGKVPV